jgi:nitrite reductase/ring-hydroxylating ferredoxin subunit/uncharacterized membrane protein
MRSKAHLKSHPIHPMLISLPIGLWIGAFVFDLLAVAGIGTNLNSAGFFATIGGCVGAALAAVPGVIDLFGAVPPSSSARQRGYIHGMLNTVALLVFIAVAWHRGGPLAMPDRLSLLLSFVGIVLIGISGWLGGTLVYRNQIGVDHRYANATKLKERSFEDFSRPVCNQTELSDGQLMLVTIGQERIAVGRCAEGVFAFADSCTHKGGPLSDGALVGCTVQCPWHGSQFDCRTGSVVAGPAEESIKTYAVEVRGGEVYVQNPTSAKNEEPTKAA